MRVPMLVLMRVPMHAPMRIPKLHSKVAFNSCIYTLFYSRIYSRIPKSHSIGQFHNQADIAVMFLKMQLDYIFFSIFVSL